MQGSHAALDFGSNLLEVNDDTKKVGQSLSHFGFVVIVLLSVRPKQGPQMQHCTPSHMSGGEPFKDIGAALYLTSA